MFKKKEKIEVQPQYYQSVTNMPTINYQVYYMSKQEKLMYFFLAFLVGGIVGYIFFGGLFKDEFYEATTKTYISNIVIFVVVGLIAGKLFLPIRTEQLKEKRKNQLKLQFRDMLDSLTTSLNAGNNVQDSFESAKQDLQTQYGEDSFIVYELGVILSGIVNSFSLESMLMDFGYRSGIDDIVSFAQVFEISYRKGGNIKDVIRNTHSILSDKMRIMEDIETQITAAKNDNNIMTVMPIFLIAVIKTMSPEFAAKFTTVSGVAATFIAVVLFVAAYIVGRKLLTIKI